MSRRPYFHYWGRENMTRIINMSISIVQKTSATAEENRPYTLWFFVLLEWLLEVNVEMQVNGVVVISDMSSFSYSHLQWLMTHPSALKERITSIQDAVPMRIKVGT